jgi:3-phosphoshikimate 1-carboxyvinyltransferase
MKERPVESLVSALKQLGLKIKGMHCPLHISGELIGGTATVEGRSSQYLSALLISLPCAPQDSVLMVNNLEERPYVEMTESWLREQGVRYSHEEKKGQDIFTVQGGQSYTPFTKTIPGDFSSASYLIAAGALFNGQVILHGLDMEDKQGDKALVEILRDMGVDIKERNGELVITGGKPLKGIRIDANAIPDLVPTLAVIGTQAKGRTEVYNIGNARLKETDRLRSMADGLTNMGAKIIEGTDSLSIQGGKLYGAKVHGYDDHRTVMALTLAGMLAEGETWIDTAEAINKTFPAFVSIMRKLGAKITMR